MSSRPAVECGLTERGRELTEEYADGARFGGRLTDTSELVEESDHGFRFLDAGSHRLVFTQGDGAQMFTHDDCVLKVAKTADPWPNQNEIVNWEFMPTEVRDIFAPVTEYADDGVWLVMAEADPDPPLPSGMDGLDKYIRDRTAEPDLDALQQRLWETGAHLDDIRKDNIGFFDGSPVIIDYGFRIIHNGTDMPDQYRDPDRDPEYLGPPSDEFFEPVGDPEFGERLREMAPEGVFD